MNYPYPQPYPTWQRCPLCQQYLRRADFRRWDSPRRDAKRILHSTCNFCAGAGAAAHAPVSPETHVINSTKLALERGDIATLTGMTRAEERIARAQARRNARASTLALRQHARERKLAWNAAIFYPLARELGWAMRALITARDNAVEDRRYKPWFEFFDAYVTVLKDIQRRARSALALKHRDGAIAPPEELAKTERYLFPETIGSLRRLYGACTPIPGIRSFREPEMMLQWRTTD